MTRHHTAPWWQVMCLTGVDYFSTLGYQPSIAFLAAGYLSPFATLVLVLLTLFGALPVYNRDRGAEPARAGQPLRARRAACRAGAARRSSCACSGLPRPTSSSRSRSRPLTPPRTSSKTRSCPHWLEHPLARDAAAARRCWARFSSRASAKRSGWPSRWWSVYLASTSSSSAASWPSCSLIPTADRGVATRPVRAAVQSADDGGLALLLFPKLALGLSGFETGVAVMPLVTGTGETEEDVLRSRIRNTQKLLKTAALIMSVMLIGSALVTATMIPAADAQGRRPGRRPRAGLPRAPRLRRGLRHALRPRRRSRSSGLPARQRWRDC